MLIKISFSLRYLSALITLLMACQSNEQANRSSKKSILNSQTNETQTMIAVIFEAIPAEGRREEYLDLAAQLRPALDTMNGFISIERFESISNPGKILSLSFWKDERTLSQWRNLEDHRYAQERGRKLVFKDYRLRVAGVIRDYGMDEREEVPKDSKAYHDNH